MPVDGTSGSIRPVPFPFQFNVRRLIARTITNYVNKASMSDQPDIFAESKLRQQRMFAQLEATPVVDILGVVAPSGVSGNKFQGDELWTLRFELEAWRIHSDHIQTRPVTIHRKVTEQELNRLREQIAPYAVICIKARVATDSPAGTSQGLLESLIGIETSDEELNERADQLQKPVIHVDPVLGTFTLDRRVDFFTGDAVWDGGAISLNLSAREPAELQEALKVAHSLWQGQNTWNRQIRDYAAEKLLPLKNDYWLDEDEAELNTIQFDDRMTLESITVYPDGSFDFWHNDGDLFCGHSILISGSLSEGPTDADIPG